MVSAYGHEFGVAAHTVNQEPHIEDSEVHPIDSRRMRWRVTSGFLFKQILKCLGNCKIACIAKVRLSKWMLSLKQRVVAWQVAFHLRMSKATGMILVEEECAIE